MRAICNIATQWLHHLKSKLLLSISPLPNRKMALSAAYAMWLPPSIFLILVFASPICLIIYKLFDSFHHCFDGVVFMQLSLDCLPYNVIFKSISTQDVEHEMGSCAERNRLDKMHSTKQNDGPEDQIFYIKKKTMIKLEMEFVQSHKHFFFHL